MKFLSIVASNFKRHRLRLALTLLSIAAAFLLYAYLAAIRNAFSMGVDIARADRLVTRHRVSIIQTLPQSYEPRIERIPGVKHVAKQSWFGGIYKENEFFAQIPVEPDEFVAVYPEVIVPKDQLEAWKKTRTGAVVGRRSAEKYGWKIGQRVALRATIWRPKKGGDTWEFDVVGIYEPASQSVDPTAFYFRHDYFDENRLWGQGEVGWYVLTVDRPESAARVAQQIDEEFANSPAETKTETEGAFVKAWADQVGNIGAIITAILSAVFFTILLVAGNTMAQAVRERTSELGVLKAVGFSDGNVLAMVLVESLLIATVGGAIGLTLGWFAVEAGDPTRGALPIFFVPPKHMVLGVVYVLLLGLIAGIFPAVQAMRLNPVEALRKE